MPDFAETVTCPVLRLGSERMLGERKTGGII